MFQNERGSSSTQRDRVLPVALFFVSTVAIARSFLELRAPARGHFLVSFLGPAPTLVFLGGAALLAVLWYARGEIPNPFRKVLALLLVGLPFAAFLGAVQGRAAEGAALWGGFAGRNVAHALPGVMGLGATALLLGFSLFLAWKLGFQRTPAAEGMDPLARALGAAAPTLAAVSRKAAAPERSSPADDDGAFGVSAPVPLASATAALAAPELFEAGAPVAEEAAEDALPNETEDAEPSLFASRPYLANVGFVDEAEIESEPEVGAATPIEATAAVEAFEENDEFAEPEDEVPVFLAKPRVLEGVGRSDSPAPTPAEPLVALRRATGAEPEIEDRLARLELQARTAPELDEAPTAPEPEAARGEEIPEESAITAGGADAEAADVDDEGPAPPLYRREALRTGEREAIVDEVGTEAGDEFFGAGIEFAAEEARLATDADDQPPHLRVLEEAPAPERIDTPDRGPAAALAEDVGAEDLPEETRFEFVPGTEDAEIEAEADAEEELQPVATAAVVPDRASREEDEELLDDEAAPVTALDEETEVPAFLRVAEIEEPSAITEDEEADPDEADREAEAAERTPEATPFRLVKGGADSTAAEIEEEAAPTATAEPEGTPSFHLFPPVESESPTAARATGGTRPAGATSDDWAAWSDDVRPYTRPTRGRARAEATSDEDQQVLFAQVTEIDDELYRRSVDLVLAEQRCSVAMLQRLLSVSFSEATALIDRMSDEGIVGPQLPSGRREILAPRGGRAKTDTAEA